MTQDIERKKIPAEAVELYSQFIHGEISRRSFLDGLKKFAVAGLTASALLDALMPNYALGQQVSKTDERIKASYETIPSPNGNGYIRGYFVRPFSADTRDATPAKLPGVIVIHENRGLNPHTEDVARRFALENFMAFAPDALSSVGGYPGDDYKGGLLFAKIDGAKRTQDFPGPRRSGRSAPRLHRESRGDRLLLRRRLRQYFVCPGWARIWARRRRSTAARPSRTMWPRSRRRFLSIMARWTSRRWRHGRPRKRR